MNIGSSVSFCSINGSVSEKQSSYNKNSAVYKLYHSKPVDNAEFHTSKEKIEKQAIERIFSKDVKNLQTFFEQNKDNPLKLYLLYTTPVNIANSPMVYIPRYKYLPNENHSLNLKEEVSKQIQYLISDETSLSVQQKQNLKDLLIAEDSQQYNSTHSRLLEENTKLIKENNFEDVVNIIYLS